LTGVPPHHRLPFLPTPPHRGPTPLNSIKAPVPQNKAEGNGNARTVLRITVLRIQEGRGDHQPQAPPHSRPQRRPPLLPPCPLLLLRAFTSPAFRHVAR